jgi:hypothetical protein
MAPFLFYYTRYCYSFIFKSTIMKKVLSIITITAVIAVVMAACKNNTATAPVSTQDTAGLAQFQAWKFQEEQSRFQAWKMEQEQLSVASKKPVVRKKTTASSGTMNSSSTHTAETAKKKGWSKAAKGAAIGGATGAVLGVIINKRNRVAGGVIGGILGGGLGYGLGRSKDKKDGRY